MIFISICLLILFLFPFGYLLLLAFASSKSPRGPMTEGQKAIHRFAVCLPAHDEASVIGETVARLKTLDYPPHLFDIHIIADHCTDQTAIIAREAGAVVHERKHGPRTGKGAALSWGLGQILEGLRYDGVVIFDADTRVDSQFLRRMDAHLAQGDLAIQGQHVISNPEKGWFPALTWAMFLVDNQIQNLGRSNLGWSAKNMGDSICFRSTVLEQMGWGAGLTEDYQLRQRLLLRGIQIKYDPLARGYGQAPLTWSQARAQRMRWIRGTLDSSRQFSRQLLAEGIRRRDTALLDGAFQAFFPSYSSLTLLGAVLFIAHLLLNWAGVVSLPAWLTAAWGGLAGLCFLYPFLGLWLAHAPGRAYIVLLTGPCYILWRTILSINARISRHPIQWVRTAHEKN